jgi:hypothetical protein
MFGHYNTFEYSPSMITHFEQALERYNSELASANDKEVDRILIKRGICNLTLGIFKRCFDLLRDALNDFYKILSSACTTIQQQLTAKEHISIVHTAFQTIK